MDLVNGLRGDRRRNSGQSSEYAAALKEKLQRELTKRTPGRRVLRPNVGKEEQMAKGEIRLQTSTNRIDLTSTPKKTTGETSLDREGREDWGAGGNKPVPRAKPRRRIDHHCFQKV